MKNLFVRWFIILLVIYAGLCTLMFSLQDKLIYFPGSAGDVVITPGDMGLDFEDLRLASTNGATIHAWYTPCKEARGTVIFSHGNAGTISGRVDLVRDFHHLRLNSLFYDYQGFGKSEGSPSEARPYDDAAAAWQFVVDTKKETPARILIWGRSLGGGVAVELATRHCAAGQRVAGLIAESTFASLADVAGRHYPFLPVRLLLRHRYDSLSKISAITCPKLFVHSPADRVVHYASGKKLYEAAPPPRTWLDLDGDHNTGMTNDARATVELKNFLREALGR